MNNYLKSYRVHLKVVGPVYIGSGKKLSKKEYIFYKNNQIAVIDIAKLYVELKKIHKVDSFEAFMLDNHENLGCWFKKNDIKYSIIDKCIRYTLNQGDINSNKRQNVLLEFVKDPYGNPYVPGSSLKGMFRTIFLADKIINHSNEYKFSKKQLTEHAYERANKTSYLSHDTSYLSHDIKKIESTAFRTLDRKDTNPDDAVNDIMSGFIVSDSEPLSVNDLTLAQKVDVHVKKGEKNLPSVRECLKPGTDIVFTVTIDTELCNIDKDYIYKAVKSFSKNYNDFFVKPFNDIPYIEDNNLFLGGGSGYASKTIVYPLFNEENQTEPVKVVQEIILITTTYDKRKHCNMHKHENDVRLGVSPHTIKCTYYHKEHYKKPLQMGLCQLGKIEDLN